MKSLNEFSGVYLHRDPIDMRKGIQGLSVIVCSEISQDLMGNNLFVFCNRRRDLLKIFYFDNSGFAVWMKRLEKQKFHWPKKATDSVVSLTPNQLQWLLNGFEISRMKPFEKLHFSHVI